MLFMRFKLIKPLNRNSTALNEPGSIIDYAAYLALDVKTGRFEPALPLIEKMAAQPGIWMPKIVNALKRCDVNPVLHANILNISAEDWLSLQRGELASVSTESAFCGQLLLDIFNLIYSFVGSAENVSLWLNNVHSLTRFDNKCPLHIIKSGDIKAIADLQRFLAGEALSSPFL